MDLASFLLCEQGFKFDSFVNKLVHAVLSRLELADAVIREGVHAVKLKRV